QKAATGQHRDGARPGLSADRRRPDGVKTGSLRLRLLAGTLAWMLLAIALVGWGLRTLFQDHVTQQLQTQLVMQLDHLSASVDWDPPGTVSVSPTASDPRLAQALS